MGIIDIFRRRATKPVPVSHYRNFQAAVANRLVTDWLTTSQHINRDLRGDLRTICARSRELVKNNDYARKFINLCISNVIGPKGMRLRMKVRQPDGTIDQADSDYIQKAFNTWAKKQYCTVDGRLSLTEVAQVALKSAIRDGEWVVRKVRSKEFRFGFALQVIDAQLLDTTYNENDRNTGRRVEMGVEMNRWLRPVGYHFAARSYDEAQSFDRNTRTRLVAEEINHGFISDYAGQVRGVPWMHSAMMRLHMLGSYEEAELVAARLGASKMGFITSETPDDFQGDGKDAQGRPLIDVQPASFHYLDPGQKLQEYSPDHPNTGFADFAKAILRGAASGLNITYESLANDREGVNYSSLRQGTLEERDQWRVLQQFVIENFYNDIFTQWLESAILSGELNLPYAKFDKFNVPQFMPRGWQWVDPAKEIEAHEKSVALGVRSRAEIMAESTGRDFDDVIDEIALENATADAKGVDITPQPETPSGLTPDDNDSNA